MVLALIARMLRTAGLVGKDGPFGKVLDTFRSRLVVFVTTNWPTVISENRRDRVREPDRRQIGVARVLPASASAWGSSITLGPGNSSSFPEPEGPVRRVLIGLTISEPSGAPPG